jgi:hypothetical protein
MQELQITIFDTHPEIWQAFILEKAAFNLKERKKRR